MKKQTKVKPLGSLVFSSQEEIATAYKPKTQEELGASLKSDDEDAKAPKLVALSEKASKRKPTVEPAPTTPLMKSELHRALKHAGFKFAQAVRAGDAVAYGYVHKDKRAVMLTVAADGSETWVARWPVAEKNEESGDDVAKLVKALSVSTARRQASLDRTAKQLATDKAKAAELAEAQLAAAKDTDVGLVSAPVVTQLLPSGPPDHVCKALMMLDNLTAHQFNMDLLRGDRHYSDRVALLRTLCNRGKGDYKAAETGINLLTQGFFTSVGVGEGTSRAAQAETFAERCADIVKAFKAAQAAARKVEKKAQLTAWRVEREKYTVPGSIIPFDKPKSRKERTEEDAATREEVHQRALALHVSPEQPAVPHPDAELILVPTELRLLAAPKNGIIMLQLEKENSQGAICIYNNGSRVAAGVVAPETLKRLRSVTGCDNAMLLEAAHQFLNPVTPGVPVTPVAARHLTAVINCKELSPMVTTSVVPSSGRKFASPAAVAKKTAKVVKAAKKTAGSSNRLNDEQTITVTAKENPYAKGSKAFNTFALFVKAKTVGAFKKLAGADKDKYEAGYVRYASRDGYIKIK